MIILLLYSIKNHSIKNHSMLLTATEENYLKAIFKLTEEADEASATTNAIATEMSIAAASVTDMLRRLSEKDLIHHEKYKGAHLKDTGRKTATLLVRKHRLWEYFLVEKLKFEWDEVHEIAEELEHVRSEELVNRLDDYLGQPRFDPHGDPIPRADGTIPTRQLTPLSTLKVGQHGVLMGLQEGPDSLMRYLKKNNIGIGTKIQVIELHDFDESISIKIDNEKEMELSEKVSKNLLLKTM